jgi:hypothetical protein
VERALLRSSFAVVDRDDWPPAIAAIVDGERRVVSIRRCVS